MKTWRHLAEESQKLHQFRTWSKPSVDSLPSDWGFGFGFTSHFRCMELGAHSCRVGARLRLADALANELVYGRAGDEASPPDLFRFQLSLVGHAENRHAG